MLLNDPIGDMLTRMRNAQHARRDTCAFPWSKLKLGICEILKANDFLESIEVSGDAPKQIITVTFVPAKELELKRVSKPGRRIYADKITMKPILRGYGIAVLSTSRGLMTDKDAKKQGVGGEVLCTVS